MRHERPQRRFGIFAIFAFLAVVSVAYAGAGNVNSYTYDEVGNITRQQLACTPTTCAAQGKTCGTIPDGCSGTLSCGNCPLGQVCLGTNVCCTPTTCLAQGAKCGSIGDGCGGTLSCGFCGSGQTCLASHLCCTPYTCQAGDCGVFSNGCGGTVNCGKCATCFVAGTPVTMADGSTKPIEEVSAGDLVLSYDAQNGTLVEAVVERVVAHPRTPALLRINGELTTTPEHRFFVNGTWVRADELRIGDRLLRAQPSIREDGAPTIHLPVTQIDELPGGVTTYNFEVAGYHDYFAGGVLVHNIKASSPSPAPDGGTSPTAPVIP